MVIFYYLVNIFQHLFYYKTNVLVIKTSLNDLFTDSFVTFSKQQTLSRILFTSTKRIQIIFIIWQNFLQRKTDLIINNVKIANFICIKSIIVSIKPEDFFLSSSASLTHHHEQFHISWYFHTLIGFQEICTMPYFLSYNSNFSQHSSINTKQKQHPVLEWSPRISVW